MLTSEINESVFFIDRCCYGVGWEPEYGEKRSMGMKMNVP